LFEVVDANSAIGLVFGFGQGRQKHRGEDGDDGNNNE
jgi:hypothetical protein